MSESECKYKYYYKEKFNGKPYCTLFNELCEDVSFVCDKNCQVFEDYKQLQQLENGLKEITVYTTNHCTDKRALYLEQIVSDCNKAEQKLKKIKEIINSLETISNCDGAYYCKDKINEIYEIIEGE